MRWLTRDELYSAMLKSYLIRAWIQWSGYGDTRDYHTNPRASYSAVFVMLNNKSILLRLWGL